MKPDVSLLVSVLLAITAAAETNSPIRTVAELYAATYTDESAGRTFEFDALTTTPLHKGVGQPFSVTDGTGHMVLRRECVPWSNLVVQAGSRIHVRGAISRTEDTHRIYARCDAIRELARGTPPVPTPVTAEELLSGHYDCQLVEVKGTVRDCFADEVDSAYVYLVVESDGRILYVPCSARGRDGGIPSIGSDILVTGCCHPDSVSGRMNIGRMLMPIHEVGIRTVRPPDKGEFDAPPYGHFGRMLPQDIAALGRLHLSGQVIAVWQNDTALIRRENGEAVKVGFAVPAPKYGQTIEAVGFPESDLYHVNLSRCIWRPTVCTVHPDPLPQDRTAGDLQEIVNGRIRYKVFRYGELMRLRGFACDRPGAGNPGGRFRLKCGDIAIQVDVSATPVALKGVDVGCELSVTGTYVPEIENCRPNNPFPQITGYMLVVRRPEDIVILARPPWWTPSRLVTVIGALLAFLAMILVWNLLLRRIVDRRSRELAEETVARATADLKVYERTRLAVELHDSIAQNLTGVALEINTANRTADTDLEKAHRHLDIAAKSLKSCRDELRYCLWDLRNSALENADMNEAIRQTLAPHIGDTELHVRFSVPRERISDSTAHAILRIVRELSVNALRHGKATSLKVAGSVESDKLRISVRDNGCGFDPETCPGIAQGHFGLLGIRERVEEFEGELTIDSKPGKGTKVTIALNVPHEYNEEQSA